MAFKGVPCRRPASMYVYSALLSWASRKASEQVCSGMRRPRPGQAPPCADTWASGARAFRTAMASCRPRPASGGRALGAAACGTGGRGGARGRHRGAAGVGDRLHGAPGERAGRAAHGRGRHQVRRLASCIVLAIGERASRTRAPCRGVTRTCSGTWTCAVAEIRLATYCCQAPMHQTPFASLVPLP